MAERDSDQLLERLKQGNSRFLEMVRTNEPRRAELARIQHPFAIVLACADSRVAPEITLDTRLGELFVVRVAGNVANTTSIASIEYAIVHLATKLIIVLAHENCGAVTSALEGGDTSKNLEHLFERITPAFPESGEGDVNTVAHRSARLNAERLTSESEILRKAVAEDGLRIVTAFFHFSTGAVEFDSTVEQSGS
jgi:carbonic anhydrase